MKKICPLLSKLPREPENALEIQNCLEEKCAWYLVEEGLLGGNCAIGCLGRDLSEIAELLKINMSDTP